MNKKEILYTTAVDRNGDLIHVDKAVKGITYYCSLCSDEFILRKSGKTGRGSRRPHFAHNQLSPNCTPEGVLHLSFKKMLFVLLQKHKSENKILLMNWKCEVCQAKDTGDLLYKAALIKEEYDLKACRPDIALLDLNEKVFAGIEIVVTHEPEDSVLQYYKENNIILIQINLTSEEDLKRVEEKITNPDVIDFCLNSKCMNCNNHRMHRKLVYSVIKCPGCLQLKKTCWVETDTVFGIHKPNDFNEIEIETAKSKGVIVEINHDKPTVICHGCEKISSYYKQMRRRTWRL